MNPSSIQKIVKRAAFAIAIYLLVSLPLIFLVVSYKNTKDHLSFLADLSANKISSYIYVNGSLWQYHGTRLAELVHLHSHDNSEGHTHTNEAGDLLDHLPVADTYQQSATTLDGKVVFNTEQTLTWPIIALTETIYESHKPVGILRIQTSLFPALVNTGLVAIFAAAIALFSYLALRSGPLRFIDQALKRFHVEEREKSKAMNTLKATEYSLAERTRRLLEAQRIGKIGDWTLNIGEDTLFLSQITRSMLQLNEDDSKDIPWTDLQAHMPNMDVEEIREAISDVIKTKSTASMDVDFQLNDGNQLRISISFTAITDKLGRTYKVSGTIQDISERREAELQLETLAYFDPLTGLANRTMFKRELAAISKRLAKGEKTSGTLLLLDLDRFKEVNDSLGHAAGDELLCKVSQQISRILRGRGFCSRLGGDEFAIILSESDHDVVNTYADQIIDALSRPFQVTNGKVTISTSIGIASFPNDGQEHETLVRHADLALYCAKEAGRGQFARFTNEMSDVAIRKMALAHDLREAAKKDNELQAWFQPQIDIQNNRITGFEALMRWNHPEMGFIPPSEFIPIAESSNLICDIGHWILRESVRVAKRWIDAGHRPYEVSVNVSAAQIWQGSLDKEISDILEETGFPPHLLCVELTESLFMDHAESSVKQTLAKLKDLGVTLALDDFGTGYSSLGYLIQLPFDKLKIDRVFVANAHESQKMQHVLRGIIALGKGLGMTIVAEGVEKIEELSMLQEFGCDQVQGFLYAKPAPSDMIIESTIKSIEKMQRAA